jgi:hypothetical protein
MHQSFMLPSSIRPSTDKLICFIRPGKFTLLRKILCLNFRLFRPSHQKGSIVQDISIDPRQHGCTVKLNDKRR